MGSNLSVGAVGAEIRNNYLQGAYRLGKGYASI